MSINPAPHSVPVVIPQPGDRAARQRQGFSRHRLREGLLRLLGYLVLVLLTLLSAFPLFWMVLTSLRARNEVFSGDLWPRQFTLAAYQFLLSEVHIMTFFGNSLWVTFWTVTAVVALATLAGYAFAHIDFWGKQLIFFTLLSTLMVPGPVLIIPLFLQMSRLQLIDTQLGLILSYIGGGLAFTVFLMRSFFSTLPSELVDAGQIDGASEFGIFWRIMLPLAKPGIATITIFQFMGTWNEFIFAATFLHTPELRTLQPAIFAMIGRYSTDWPGLAAGLTISVLPIILIYVFMQQHFVTGLTSGAIKG